jgi:cysteine desulfurase
MIYLDYASYSPVDNQVLNVFNNISTQYIGNPNSMHKLGLEAKELLDNSTSKIAEFLGVKKDEIIYTSGATESNNLAIKGLLEKYGSNRKHIITTTLNHTSINGTLDILEREHGYEVECVKVLKDGSIDLEDLEEIITKDTVLVTIPYVDSEVGIVQPVEKIGKFLKDNYPNVYFFVDATQAVGKININTENVDLMTISPHKFYGLNSIGILIKKENVMLKPLINGGKSTTIYRSGTPDLALVASTAKAFEVIYPNIESNYKYVKMLNQKVREELLKYQTVHINSMDNSMPFTLNFSISDISSIDLVKELEKHEIYVSTKTACCPVNTVSRCVYELTNSKKLALSTVRVSFSHLTNENEIDEFLKYFKICYEKVLSNK